MKRNVVGRSITRLSATISEPDHLRQQDEIGANRRHRHADAFQRRNDAVALGRRRRQRLCSGVNLLEETAVILAQSDKTRFTPLVRPVSQRTLKKPRAVSVEIVDAGDIDRDAARRDGLCDSIDLRLDRAGIFGGPRAGGAKLDPIAARLATEQDACRHRTAPSSMAQHHAPTLDPSRADEPRQDWMRCGGTLRLRARPIGRRWAQLKSRTERNLSPRPSLLKVNKSVVILKRRLPF